MLGDFPQNAWHVLGFPHEDVFVAAEEADERAFLFVVERGTNAHHFSHGAPEAIRTFLEPSTGSKDPVDFMGLGASSVTSLLMVASSLEAMIAAA